MPDLFLMSEIIVNYGLFLIFMDTETAVNIGYSCQLLTDDLIDVFVVDGDSLDEVEKQLIKFKESVKIVNTFHPPSKLYDK